MTDYSGMTVAQLKDQLKARDLPTQGLKANLVERLQQADAETADARASATDGGSVPANKAAAAGGDMSAAAAAAGPPAAAAAGSADKEGDAPTDLDAAQAQQQVQSSLAASSDATARGPVAAADAACPSATVDGGRPKKQELSPDEMKQKAVVHLSKKLHRAKKFGGDEAVIVSLQKQLARLEKFGLDLSTQLAQELGFSKGPPAAAAVTTTSFNPRRRPQHHGKKFKNHHHHRR
ncbi:Tho1p Ecym_4331 [Eremothecium cymbalariae DBVPG|uniref:SAP domain-containing protein n=1 Tax=Eremothecium cymbalariae (strain CBS 270.75 / DBVPG 7215 / KCTC 17166 / NRRL Y-17582) TaxID=931890 RepID=G8JTP0_ERECY|nr:hypothetical protein Ecym_4331 [Eremothecium cymbalariae DBVPG\